MIREIQLRVSANRGWRGQPLHEREPLPGAEDVESRPWPVRAIFKNNQWHWSLKIIKIDSFATLFVAIGLEVRIYFSVTYLFVSFHSLKNEIIVGIFITIKVKSALYPFQ